MSTRGLFGFVIDNEVKAVYNHFDSYPEGLGQDLVNFLQGTDLSTLPLRARGLQPVPDRTPTPEEVARLRPFTDLTVSGRSAEDWYCLLRKTQGDVEALLAAGIYEDSGDFALDSLFCEWGYLINLDDSLFEVYKGFQRKAHTQGRFAKENDRKGYYPIALIKTFPLDDIPLFWQKELRSEEE